MPADASAGESPTPISQAAAVAFRMRQGQAEVCLVTSLKKGKWILPKGVVDSGETPPETAVKECEEEAGLHGRVLGPRLGRYEDFKWGTTLQVDVYLLEVEQAEATWPECDVRQRAWFSPTEAAARVSKPRVRKMLRRAARKIAKYRERE